MKRLYRILLGLYPPSFRERYGRAILETLERRGREARRERAPARLSHHVRELFGLAAGVAAEWTKTTTDGRTTMGGFGRELRQAARRLIRTPGFTAASVLTLALAIGANTAIYSVVKGVVLDPLPYPGSDRLVWLDHAGPGVGAPLGLYMTRGLFGFYRENSRTLQEVAIYRTFEVTLAGDPRPERVDAVQATWTLFSVLAVPPALGRVFVEGDDYGDGQGAVILSHGLWQRRFGGDPAVVGRVIRIEEVPHEVVGVMPAGFHYPDPETDVYLPRVVAPGFGGWVERGVARMAPGFTAADVERDLTDLVPRIPDAFEDAFARRSVDDARIAPRIVTLKEHVVGGVRTTLWILMGSVGLVLLIACANVANLLLVRAEVRSREVALRRALGGDGWAMTGFFASESLVLATVGGAAGVGLAAAGLRVLVALAPSTLPRLQEVALDGRVLAFAAGITLLSALTFGSVSLFRRREKIVVALKEGTRTSAGAGRSLLRRFLVVSQVALALVLLVGAGLMIRSFWNLKRLDTGLRAEGVLTFAVGLPNRSYPGVTEAATFHSRLLERLAGLPGVETVGAVRCLPLRTGCRAGDPLYEEGLVYQEGEVPPIVRLNLASGATSRPWASAWWREGR